MIEVHHYGIKKTSSQSKKMTKPDEIAESYENYM